MEDQNVLTGQETHYQLYDWIQYISHEGRNWWHTCYIFIEEECISGHYQDYIRIPTNNSI